VDESEFIREEYDTPVTASLESYPSISFKYSHLEHDNTTLGHSGSNACNSVMERDEAEALSVKQEALTF